MPRCYVELQDPKLVAELLTLASPPATSDMPGAIDRSRVAAVDFTAITSSRNHISFGIDIKYVPTRWERVGKAQTFEVRVNTDDSISMATTRGRNTPPFVTLEAEQAKALEPLIEHATRLLSPVVALAGAKETPEFAHEIAFARGVRPSKELPAYLQRLVASGRSATPTVFDGAAPNIYGSERAPVHTRHFMSAIERAAERAGVANHIRLFLVNPNDQILAIVESRHWRAEDADQESAIFFTEIERQLSDISGAAGYDGYPAVSHCGFQGPVSGHELERQISVLVPDAQIGPRALPDPGGASFSF